MSTPMPSRRAELVGALRHMGAYVGGEFRIDRTQLQPVARGRGVVRVAAWVAIVGLFAWGWGEGTVVAIHQLLFGGYVPPHYGPHTVGHQIGWLVQDLALVAVAVVVLVLFRRYPEPRSPFPQVGPKAWWSALFLAPLGVGIGFFLAGVQTLFGGPAIAYPVPTVDGTAAHVLYTLQSIMPGPTEELVLLAVVVTVLRRAGYGL